MKITGVRTRIYENALDRPIADANRPEGLKRLAGMLLFLDTDAGITGVSLGSPGVVGAIEQVTADLLVGKDPRGVRGLWKLMVDAVFKGGNRGAQTAVISALDIALWDIKAKAAGEPLWKTLGSSTRRVLAYASGLDLCLDDAELGRYYRKQAGLGISAGKLKIGLELERDITRIGIMRDALAESGKPVALTIDVNEYWSPKQTIRFMHRIEEQFDITWIEEPARRWDHHGLAKVSNSIRASVATGENLRELQEFTPLVANGAVDVVEAGSNSSGITGCMQIAELAYAFDLPFAMMNCPGNFMAPVAAALPNHYMMEVVDAGRDSVFTADNHVEDGWIVLGDQPGLGITVDEEKLEKLAVDAPSDEARRMGWGRRRGAAMYQVPPGEPERFDE